MADEEKKDEEVDAAIEKEEEEIGKAIEKIDKKRLEELEKKLVEERNVRKDVAKRIAFVMVVKETDPELPKEDVAELVEAEFGVGREEAVEVAGKYAGAAKAFGLEGGERAPAEGIPPEEAPAEVVEEAPPEEVVVEEEGEAGPPEGPPGQGFEEGEVPEGYEEEEEAMAGYGRGVNWKLVGIAVVALIVFGFLFWRFVLVTGTGESIQDILWGVSVPGAEYLEAQERAAERKARGFWTWLFNPEKYEQEAMIREAGEQVSLEDTDPEASLEFTQAEILPSSVFPGSTASLRFTLKNLGTKKARNVKVGAKPEDKFLEAGGIVGSYGTTSVFSSGIEPLNPGEPRLYDMPITAPDCSKGRFEVTASTNYLYEAAATNNIEMISAEHYKMLVEQGKMEWHEGESLASAGPFKLVVKSSRQYPLPTDSTFRLYFGLVNQLDGNARLHYMKIYLPPELELTGVERCELLPVGETEPKTEGEWKVFTLNFEKILAEAEGSDKKKIEGKMNVESDAVRYWGCDFEYVGDDVIDYKTLLAKMRVLYTYEQGKKVSFSTASIPGEKSCREAAEELKAQQEETKKVEASMDVVKREIATAIAQCQAKEYDLSWWEKRKETVTCDNAPEISIDGCSAGDIGIKELEKLTVSVVVKDKVRPFRIDMSRVSVTIDGQPKEDKGTLLANRKYKTSLSFREDDRMVLASFSSEPDNDCFKKAGEACTLIKDEGVCASGLTCGYLDYKYMRGECVKVSECNGPGDFPYYKENGETCNDPCQCISGRCELEPGTTDKKCVGDHYTIGVVGYVYKDPEANIKKFVFKTKPVYGKNDIVLVLFKNTSAVSISGGESISRTATFSHNKYKYLGGGLGGMYTYYVKDSDPTLHEVTVSLTGATRATSVTFSVDNAAPNAPDDTTFSVSNRKVGENAVGREVVVKWKQAPSYEDIERYLVYACRDADCYKKDYTNTNYNASVSMMPDTGDTSRLYSMTIGNLANGDTYDFYVCSVDGAGNKNCAGPKDVTVEDETPPSVLAIVSDPNTVFPDFHKNVTIYVLASEEIDPVRSNITLWEYGDETNMDVLFGKDCEHRVYGSDYVFNCTLTDDRYLKNADGNVETVCVGAVVFDLNVENEPGRRGIHMSDSQVTYSCDETFEVISY